MNKKATAIEILFISMLFSIQCVSPEITNIKIALTCFISALAVNRCKATGLFLATLNYCDKFVRAQLNCVLEFVTENRT